MQEALLHPSSARTECQATPASIQVTQNCAGSTPILLYIVLVPGTSIRVVLSGCAQSSSTFHTSVLVLSTCNTIVLCG
jgi:hypothetical protein